MFDMDSSSLRNSGISFVLHTPLLEAEVVDTFLKLCELVTIPRASDHQLHRAWPDCLGFPRKRNDRFRRQDYCEYGY